MKFFIELSLEGNEVTELTILEDIEDEIYRSEFIDPNTDKPIDIHEAVQLIKDELESCVE